METESDRTGYVSGRLRHPSFDSSTGGVHEGRYAFRKCLETVKGAVPLEDYAATLTGLRKSGLRLTGVCPMHEEKTPSFTIYPESQSWYCFGACAKGGDIFDLYQAIEGGEIWEAMVGLALRYGVELPERSPKWHRWQGEKLAIEDLAENVRFGVRCRRIFKLMILNSPEIQNIEDPVERREEVRACYRAFQEGLLDIDRKAKRKMMGRLG